MRQQRMLLLWLSFVFVAFGAFGQTIQFLDENEQPLTTASQFANIWIQVTDSASAGLGAVEVEVSSDIRGDHFSAYLQESPADSGIFRALTFLNLKAPWDTSTGFGLTITEDPGPPHRFDTVRVTVLCQTPPCAEASIPTWASSLRFLDDYGNPLSRIPAGATIFLEGRDNSNRFMAVTLTAQPGGDTEAVNLYYAGGFPADIFFRAMLETEAGPAVPGDGMLQIEEGGTLTASHDNYLGLSATTISAPTGSLLLELLDHQGNPTDTVFEHSVVRVRATDPGGNLSPAGVDTVTVTAVARDTGGASRDTETFDLAETGPDTGVFVGQVPFWGTPGPVAENGTLENWHTGSGAPDTVVVTYGPASVSGAVLPGRIWFADAAGNPVTQFSLGSRMYIFAEGDSYNVDPGIVNYISYVSVRLDSGPYVYIELYETGPDTGLFSGYVNTGPNSTYPNFLYPPVGEGVEATVVYGDPVPFSARATIGPNLPPVAVDDAATVSEEVTAQTPVLLNDSDPENERLTLDSITVPPLHGTAWIENGENVMYHPETDFNGTDTLRYRVRDLTGETAEATVTYTVVGTNDPPVVGNGLIIDAVEDTPRTFTIPVSDVEGEATTLVWLVPPADGTLAVNPDGSFTYTPAPNANGDRTFTVRYQDTSGATSDGTSTLRIAAVNDPPVAVDDAFVMPEDYWGLFDPLVNDSDPDGEPVVITSVTQPSHGTLEGWGLYRPYPNYNGQDSYTYTVTDASGASSTATVRFTLTSVPDPPVAAADSAVTQEDTPVSISVLANDSDGDGDTLTITYDGTQPSHGVVMFGDPGILIYRPVINYAGPDSFVYVISDGHGFTATATVTLTVTPVNDPPVATNDILAIDEDTVGTLSVLANDSDVEGDTLTITAVTQGTHGTTVIRTGTPMTLGYTPVANYAGSDVLTYTISDGHGGTATATVNLVVRQIPDPPVAVADTATTSEDAAVTVNVLANDSDPDNNTLSVAGLLTLPAHGTAVRNPNNTVTYTPAANYNGSDSFTYNLADGTGRFAVGTVQVTVQPVNDPPAAAGDSAVTREGVGVSVSVLANDSDIEGNPLTVTGVSTPATGTTTFTASTVTYTPAANFNGTDSFTYTVSDGATAATGTVTVTVKDALERVAVLATNSVSLLTGADVLSGDVVVNQAGAGPFLGGVELSLAGTITTPSGWDVEGNRVTVAAGASVASDVFSNQLANSGTITGQQVSTLALPVFSSLPAFLAATPNTTDVNVTANGNRTLAPGTYRDLTVGKKGTVLFTGGTYHFRSITTDTQAKMLFSAAATVRVQQKLSVKATSTVGPNTGASINAAAIIFHVAGINGTGGGLAETPKAVEIGTDNILTANVYAPNGTLLVGDRTQARGGFIARDVQVGPDVQVTLQTAWSGQ